MFFPPTPNVTTLGPQSRVYASLFFYFFSFIPLDRWFYCAYIVNMERRKPDEERKESLVRIRLTAEQKDLLTAAALKVGLDLSGWLRFIALKEAKALLEPEKTK
jgi:hypothetical protein